MANILMRLFFAIFFIAALTGCVAHVVKITAPIDAAQINSDASARTTQKSELAIVLLHGKWGMPPAPLVKQFREAGYKVVSPEMGWSREMAYSIDYEASLQRVNVEVESLRQQGFKKIVLGGQSLFTDFNDGNRTKVFSTSPQAYLSYFDPDGLASMPKTATNQKKVIPVMVFMGRSDWVTRQGAWYFFNRLPKHPANKYVVSDAEHRQVPQASFPSAIQWVESHVLK